MIKTEYESIVKNSLSIAIALTANKFRNKTDKGGQPYILHCLRVMEGVNNEDEELRCIAIMHDLIEDTDITSLDLKSIGFSDRVVKGVEDLTRNRKESYSDYILRISKNEDAIKVKLSDLKDNSDITRLKGVTRKDLDRVEKYHKAYTYLKNLI